MPSSTAYWSHFEVRLPWKPEGPLTLRVYPPTAPGEDCRGNLYLDDGISYGFEKGQFLRVEFACRSTAKGLTVTLSPREGSFDPWWKSVSIEVYSPSGPAAAASASTPGGINASAIPTGFNSDQHRITASVFDDGKGLQVDFVY